MLCDIRKAMKMGATNVEKRSLKTKHLAPIFRAELRTSIGDGANYDLLVIQHGSGDQFVGGKEQRRARNFLGRDQAAEGPRLTRFLQPRLAAPFAHRLHA